jgi:hypothetical protein
MGEPDEYERKAAEADERARLARDPEVKHDWERVAEQWRRLAAEARGKRRQ